MSSFSLPAVFGIHSAVYPRLSSSCFFFHSSFHFLFSSVLVLNVFLQSPLYYLSLAILVLCFLAFFQSAYQFPVKIVVFCSSVTRILLTVSMFGLAHQYCVTSGDECSRTALAESKSSGVSLRHRKLAIHWTLITERRGHCRQRGALALPRQCSGQSISLIVSGSLITSRIPKHS